MSLLICIGFFGLMLALGALAFGRLAGSWTRGAAVPLMAVPLVSDWIRFLANASHSVSWGIACSFVLGCCVIVAIVQWKAKGRSAVTFPPRSWWLALGILLAIHLLIRSWIGTGRLPNPADDIYGGFKSSALFHSLGWPATHPEVPELPFSYYYYSYCWPAGIAAWTGASFLAGWWTTAVVLCVSGCMLVWEVMRRASRGLLSTLVLCLIITGGATFSYWASIAQGHGPKDWGGELKSLIPESGPYLRVPQQWMSFWGPFAVFGAGLLVVCVALLRKFLVGKARGFQVLLLILALGCIAGYCTFHLLGFVAAIVPMLLLWLWRFHGRKAVPAGFLRLMGLGLTSALTCLPFLSFIAQRSVGTRQAFFQPIIPWLLAGDFSSTLPIFCFVIGAFILVCALANPLPAFCLFRLRHWRTFSPSEVLCASIFLWGCFISFFSLTDDFVPKFGSTVAVFGVLWALVAGLHTRPLAKWLFVLGALGPLLAVGQHLRANLVKKPLDPIWTVLDKEGANNGIPVLYALGADRDARGGWDILPPFFSRARFVVPANEIDASSQNFLPDSSLLATLPSTAVRIRSLERSPGEHLLLSGSKLEPAPGEVLYKSQDFTLYKIGEPARR